MRLQPARPTGFSRVRRTTRTTRITIDIELRYAMRIATTAAQAFLAVHLTASHVRRSELLVTDAAGAEPTR